MTEVTLDTVRNEVNKSLTDLNKTQREDHDVTIRLDAKFDLFTQESRQNQSAFKEFINEIKKSVGDLAQVVDTHGKEIETLKREEKSRKDINIDRANRRRELNVVAVTAGTLLMAFGGILSVLIAMGVIK